MNILAGLPKVSHAAAQAPLNPYEFIAQGSTIRDPAKDVVFADLDGDGMDEAVLFYLVPNGKFVKPSIKVLKREGKFWQDWWRTSADVGWGIDPPSGVYDMLKTGRPQIVSYIGVGASCGGLLDVYQFDPLRGVITSLAGWAKQSCAHNLKVRDLGGDGIPEIIFTETNYDTIAHIYWWNGDRFVLSDSNFPRFYDKELRRLVRDALAPGSPAREMWGRIAVQIYMLQHRYQGAIDFCQQLLSANHAGEATRTSTTQTRAIQSAAALAFDAVLHEWIGEAYKSLNQLARARSEIEQARELALAAKRLDPYVTPLPLN
jgi:hypothetical protein